MYGIARSGTQGYSGGAGTITGTIFDADNRRVISGATVSFRGMTYTTGSDGKYTFTVSAGRSDITFSKSGYMTESVSVKIRSGQTITLDMPMNEPLAEGHYKIVVTWATTPRDLDMHLKQRIGGTDYHTYYGSKTLTVNGILYASLDYDVTSGSGPETMRFMMNGVTEGRLYIYNYTGGDDNALSYSECIAKIYGHTGLMYTFRIPTGVDGRYWDILTLRNNSITINNRIVTSEPTLS